MDEQSSLNKAVIVLAEDHKALLDGIAELLIWDSEKYEIEVHKAENGRIALEKMGEVTPDLIISDRMMPEMDGEQFFQAVRDKLDWLDIPFIFLTAAGAPQAILEGWIMGVDKYIIKPFDDDHLVDMVEMLLDDFFAKREIRHEKSKYEKEIVLRAIGHEFRHPLTFISLMQQIIEMSHDAFDDDLSQMMDSLNDISNYNQRLHRFVNNIIMSHDLRVGNLKMHLSPTVTEIPDFSQLVRESWEEFSQNLGKYAHGCHNVDKITFSADIPDTLPTIFGSPYALKYAIIHILENALKFVDKPISLPDPLQEKGSFAMRVHHDEKTNEIHITVNDDGMGFPTILSNQLFRSYYQWKRHEFEQQGGGTGLYLAKGIVKMHNGRIKAESPGFTHGATFTIALPVYESESVRPFGSDANVQESTILIVEDDIQIQDLLCDLLSMHQDDERKYNVLTANNGVEALRLLEEQAIPDLIISDISMPEMDGLEFIQRVKENRDWLHIPVMFLTALPREEVDVQRIPVNDYIVKPFQPDELLRRIATRLKRYHKIEEYLRAAVAHVTSNMLVSLESEFLPTIQVNLDETDKLKAAIEQADSINDELRIQVKDYLSLIQGKCEQMKHYIETYVKLLDLSIDANLDPDSVVRVDHADPGRVIRERLDELQYNSSHFDNLVGTQQVDLVHEATELPSMLDYASITDREAASGMMGTVADTKTIPAVAFVTERLVHFVLSHAVPEPSVVAQVMLNSDDHTIYVRVCTPRSKLTDEQIEMLRLYLENKKMVGTWGSDLMLARVYTDLFNGQIGLAYNNDALTLTMALPIS